jgi:hypothetical protein
LQEQEECFSLCAFILAQHKAGASINAFFLLFFYGMGKRAKFAEKFFLFFA